MILSQRKLKKKIDFDNINTKILNYLDKYFLLLKELNININNPELKKNIIYRAINIIAAEDKHEAFKLINKLIFDVTDKSYLALLIRIYAINHKIDEALEIYNKLPQKKKRFIIVIFDELATFDKNKAYQILINYIYNKYVITEEDISKIYNLKKLDEILNIMSDNQIILKNPTFFLTNINKIHTTNIKSNVCMNCNNQLKKFWSSEENLSNLRKNLINEYFPNEEEINNLKKKLLINKYDIFIDGNNVLFFKDREVNIDSFKRLNIIFNKLKTNYNPLIFMHIRHQKNINKLKLSKEANKILNKLTIYFTPYKMNDDWFFIWAGLFIDKSLIVTNDLLRDHIFKISDDNLISNTLSIWIDNNTIRYEYIKNEYILIFPDTYSKKIKNFNAIWHLPLYNNKWLCLS